MSSTERMQILRERRREAGEPIEDREKARTRKAVYRARIREQQGLSPVQPRVRKPKLRPFMGIDGEGCGKDRKGRQHYMLLCAGNDEEQYELYTGKPLTTEQCLEFIVSLPADVILTGFSFGYDATMILNGLPASTPEDTPWKPSKRQDILADKEEWPQPPGSNCEPRPRWSKYTYIGQYGVEWLSHNHFRVCRLETVRKKSGNITWMHPRVVKGSARTVYEGFSFFQKKFAKALRDFKIGSAEERQEIARNKAERANFQRITRQVRDYCAMECALHARMMEGLRTACLAADIKPATWNGPGKLAVALHDKHGTPKADDIWDGLVPSGVLMFSDAAYYGGRFETPRIGRLPPLWTYDINSAYPSAMRDLPCLEHGKWEYVDGEAIQALHRSDRQALFVAQVHYQHTAKDGCRGMCGLPHRQTGREPGSSSKFAGVIAWPLQGRGTYWSCEIRSAELLGARCRFGSGWVYVKQCDCAPFGWIEPLYAYRKSLGSSTAGYPIKLAINSLYGKLAQQIGKAPYNNPVWAGLITARVRSQLNEAIAQNPEAICMIATDGLYSLEPLNLPIGSGLGQWEAARMPHGMFICQPGFYWEPTGTTGRGIAGRKKTRGFSAGWLTWHRKRAFERAWTAYAEREPASPRAIDPPSVDLKLRLFIGMALAESRGDSWQAGRWVDDVKTLSFSWFGKRGKKKWCDGPSVHTLPHLGGADWISASYLAEAPAEAEDMAGAEFEDQPDYVEWD